MTKLSNYRTTISEQNGLMTVVYVSTPIVQWNSNKIILNNGGYQTVTTKRKMNQAASQFDLPYQVYQKNYQWFVSTEKGDFPFNNKLSIDRLSGEITNA